MKKYTIASQSFMPAHTYNDSDFTVEYGLQSPFVLDACSEDRCHLIVMPDGDSEAEFYWHAADSVRKNIWLDGRRVIYVPQTLPYALDWKREAALIRFSFTKKFLRQADSPHPQDGVIIRHEWKMAGGDQMVRELFVAFGKLCRHPEKHAQRSRYLEALGVFAARHIMAQLISQKLTSAEAGLPHVRLKRVIEHIEQNLDSQILTRTLAHVAGFGEHHFTRLFKASTGMVPKRYIIMKRLQSAQHMLAAGDMTLSEVAAAAGFFDQSHMGKALRRFCGVSAQSAQNADFILKNGGILQSAGN